MIASPSPPPHPTPAARVAASKGAGAMLGNFYTDDSPTLKLQPVRACVLEAARRRVHAFALRAFRGSTRRSRGLLARGVLGKRATPWFNALWLALSTNHVLVHTAARNRHNAHRQRDNRPSSSS